MLRDGIGDGLLPTSKDAQQHMSSPNRHADGCIANLAATAEGGPQGERAVRREVCCALEQTIVYD